MKNIPKITAKVCFAVCVCILIIGIVSANRLPERLYATSLQEIGLSFPLPMVAKPESLVSADGQQPENGVRASVELFGVIPIGTTKVRLQEETSVVVGGDPFGIKILADGVLIVGFHPVSTPQGSAAPAKDAGLKEGDLILTVNGQKLLTNTELTALVEGCNGNPLTVCAKRNQKTLTVTVTPVAATDGHYRVGMWVRDSTAGLGTMTFYHPESGVYGGLGHGVCDSDTGQLMSLSKGEIVEARVNGVTKATAGRAGELQGSLINQVPMGSILYNGTNGVYGVLRNPAPQPTVKVARKQEVTKGEATLYACVDGSVQPYGCTIRKINLNENADHHMVVCVTDQTLLQKTGGIVQGMSGSPIVQNGKLIGAVTHVFLNDPTKGYGIFAENMLETAQSVAEENKLKEAS